MKVKPTPPKTIPASECSIAKMVGVNEHKFTKVIHNGVVKQWVGIGWVSEGEPTKAQKETLPQVVD